MESKGKKDFNFEKSLGKLEKIVTKLESTDLQLEDSLKFFEDGVSLVKKCENHLKGAEQKIEILTKNSFDNIKTENFDGDKSQDDSA